MSKHGLGSKDCGPLRYYSAKKKDTFQSFVGKWINFETMTLSEINQSQNINNVKNKVRLVLRNREVDSVEMGR